MDLELKESLFDPNSVKPTIAEMSEVEVSASNPLSRAPTRFVNAVENFYTVDDKAADIAGIMGRFDKSKSEAAEYAKIRNAKFFSERYGIPVSAAYMNHDQIVKKMYPQEELSAETFNGRMRLIADKRRMSDKVALLSFRQMMSGGDTRFDDEIKKLERSMPLQTEVDKVTEYLSDKDKSLIDKIAVSFSKVAYIAADQIPMWVEQAKYGAAASAILAVSAGVASGGSAVAPAAKAGFVLGASGYEAAIEAGNTYREAKLMAEASGVELDPVSSAIAALASGIVISAIDNMTKVKILKGVSSSQVSKLGIELLKNGPLRIIGKEALSAAFTGALSESVTEFIQELIGDFAASIIVVDAAKKAGVEAEAKKIGESLNDALAVGIMSLSVGFFAAGGGQAITTTRTVMKSPGYRSIVNIRNTAKSSGVDINKLAKESGETLVNDAIKSERGESKDSPGIAELRDKKFDKLWQSLESKYGLTRPVGVYSRDSSAEISMAHKGNGYTASARFTPTENGMYELDLSISDNAGKMPAESAKFRVYQGEYGVDVSMLEDTNNAERDSWLEYKAREIAKDHFREGVGYDIESLNLEDNVKKIINEMENTDEFAKSIIARDAKIGAGQLGARLIILTNTLDTLIDNDLGGTVEADSIRQSIYHTAQFQALLKGIYGPGIKRANKLLSYITTNAFIPKKLRDSAKKRLTSEYKVRAPLTKREESLLSRAQERPADARTAADRNILEYAKLPEVGSLPIDRFVALYNEMKDTSRLGEDISSMQIGASSYTLEQLVDVCESEIYGFQKIRQKDALPAEAQNERIKNRAKNIANKSKHLFVTRQTRFYFLVEHLAGGQSALYHAVYRNLNKGNQEAVTFRFKMQDLFSQKMIESGINMKDLYRWQEKEIDINGTKLTNSQLVEIYMESRNADNWKTVLANGMTYHIGKSIHRLSKDSFDFKGAIDKISNDDVAMAVADAARAVYDEVGKQVSETYFKLYKTEFSYLENYYPKILEREAYNKGDADLFTYGDNGEISGITMSKPFINDRIDGNGPVRLSPNGIFETLSRSLVRESNFVFMEIPFHQASKIIFNEKVVSAIEKTASREYYDIIVSGLEAWAGKRIEMTGFDEVVMKLTRNATKAGIGMNPFSAAKAALSVVYGARYVSPGNMLEAMGEYGRHAKDLYDKFYQMSPMFRERVIGGSLPEINDVLAGKQWKRLIDKGKFGKVGTTDMNDALFWMINLFDRGAVTTVMEAAYQEALDQFEAGKFSRDMKVALGFDESAVSKLSFTEKQAAAVAFAEYVTSRTQPDFRTQARSEFQRGSALSRMASVYGSFVNVTQNMFHHTIWEIKHYGLDAETTKNSISTLCVWAICLTGAAGVDALKNELLRREQPGLWEILSKGVFGNTFIIRDLQELAMSVIKYGQYRSKSGQMTYQKTIDQTITGSVLSIGGLITGEEKDVFSGLSMLSDAISTMAGLPRAALGYTMEAANKWIIDKEED
jgi:hypothetical protein